MFCADYVAAFLVHGIATIGLIRATRAAEHPLENGGELERLGGGTAAHSAPSGGPSGGNDLIARWVGAGLGRPETPPIIGAPLLLGATSGFVGAVAVAPFDFVRQVGAGFLEKGMFVMAS